MKNRIELTIEHKDPYMVQLTNGNGDTFTYNPCKHEGLDDFLNGAKILTITDLSDEQHDAKLPVVKSFYCQDENYHKIGKCKEQCITCFSKNVDY